MILQPVDDKALSWDIIRRSACILAEIMIRKSQYRTKPLYDHLPTWQDWLPEYRQLIIEVQEMVDEHTAQGTWRRPGSAYARSR